MDSATQAEHLLDSAFDELDVLFDVLKRPGGKSYPKLGQIQTLANSLHGKLDELITEELER